MKASTKIETAADIKDQKLISQQQREAQQQQAKERKARMQEMDRERQKKVPPTESETAQR
jgi:hypothetical protein